MDRGAEIMLGLISGVVMVLGAVLCAFGVIEGKAIVAVMGGMVCAAAACGLAACIINN